MSKEFQQYKKEANKLIRHKNSNSKHIMLRKHTNFKGFSEQEIWGNFTDFDYEKWLKEQG